MKVLSYRCICPVCREHFTAFLGDTENFQRDEVDHSQRALLCIACERKFLNTLYLAIRMESTADGDVQAMRLRLSALLQEALRAGEPGPSAQVGTDQARGLSPGMQGMPDGNRNKEVSHRVSGHVEQAHETLRGPILLPPDPVGEEGVM
jgi:hypothetical protein